MTSSDPAARGVYGFKVTGLRAGDALVSGVPRSWEQVSVRQELGGGDACGELSISDERASIPIDDGFSGRIDRRRRIATLIAAEPCSEQLVVHPFLAIPGMLFAHWEGREAFHGGAFLAGGGAWGLLGDKRAGKSSQLAALAGRGVPILSDDLLVVEEGSLLAGPRCIDLRPEPAEALGLIERTTPIRGRRRLLVGTAPPSSRLRGWIFLAESADPIPRRLGARERLERLLAGRMLVDHQTAHLSLLDLASLPGWELGRPRQAAHLAHSLELTAERILELSA